ncbi:MAG: ABC transporter ATP-binding protein [Lachnospiraceae bacterium]|nr:ABC transporter ATP-binding protein [Lachnospiraceae bacterium]
MIKINNLTMTYNLGKENEFKALDNISLEIKGGELVAIIGKSGAGKSTLLHIIGCIDNYEAGEYYLDSELIKLLKEKKATRIRNEKIGIVMQDYALIEDFTALENVMIPLDFAKNKKRNNKKIALEILELMGMRDIAKKKVKNMSGGQKQRVAIARAMVNNPKILLADEPTGALDSNTSEDIMRLFKNLNKKYETTVIIVTHDMEVADKCDRIIELSDGKIVDSK